MTQHTPGPWEKNRHGKLLGSNGKHVCLWSSGIGNAPRSPRTEANTTLVTAAPDLLEALKTVVECGCPERVSLYDEEGVDGWRWTHPNGDEWDEIGSWDEQPPIHPVAARAIAKALGKS